MHLCSYVVKLLNHNRKHIGNLNSQKNINYVKNLCTYVPMWFNY
jgi:hypothetical protein